jgi:GT2 family glycosyltransferase
LADPVGVTVVVPTLNRGGFLFDTLQDLLAQEHRPLEILVVDQSDTVPDQIASLVRAHPDLISYHTVSFRGLPKARNYGLQHTRYDAIVYVDDDIRCGPTLVSEHLHALSLPCVGAVAGHITEQGRSPNPSQRPGRFRYWSATPERTFNQEGQSLVDHVPGCNFATWRQVAVSIGGFDEVLNHGAALYEETEFCLRLKRAGYQIMYNGNARLNHLTAAAGGCRVDQVESYVWALAHNRAILIRRYLRWYHKPLAYAELFRLGLAYAVYYRNPHVLKAAIAGSAAGLTPTGKRKNFSQA